MAKPSKTMVRDAILQELFNSRILKAHKEYEAVVVDSPHATQLVNYRNNMFNPLQLKPNEVVGVFTVQADTTYGNALDRYIRVMDDIHEMTGHLTYILNYTAELAEVMWLVFGEYADKLSPQKLEELDNFRNTNESRFKYIKKMRLLKDML